MNTRERLREQRKKSWLSFGAFYGLGLGTGFGLNMSTWAAVSDFWPVWGAVLVSFALGGLTAIIYWSLTGQKKMLQE